MPRIKVSKPASEEVAKYPREYTVFTQIPGALDGEVEAEVSSYQGMPSRYTAQHDVVRARHLGHRSRDMVSALNLTMARRVLRLMFEMQEHHVNSVIQACGLSGKVTYKHSESPGCRHGC